jgi:hypothetical protein
MLLNILKILTILSFCSVIIEGEHIGGPLIMFLFIALGSGEFLYTLFSAGCLISLFVLFLSVINPFHITSERIVIPLIILFPLILVLYAFTEARYSSPYFFIPAGVFIALGFSVIVLTLKKRKGTEKISPS